MESGDERNTCGSNKKNMTEEKSREGGIICKLSGMKVQKVPELSDDQIQPEM